MKGAELLTIATTTVGTTAVSFFDTVEPALRILSLCVSIFVSLSIYARKRKTTSDEEPNN